MNKNDFLRSRYLILVMIIISFSLFLLIMTLDNLRLISINTNNYLTKNTSEFSLKVIDNNKIGQLKNAIRKTDVTEIRSEDGYTFYYFNENSKYGPIIKYVEDETVDEVGVFLGEKLFEVFEESGNDRFTIEDINGRPMMFRVLGVIESSKYDFKDYSYYLTMNFNDISMSYNGIYKIDGKGALERFKALEKEDIIELTLLNFSYFDTSGDEFNNMKINFNIGLLILFFIVLIFVSYFWFMSYSDEQKARRICGANRSGLISMLVIKYIFIIAFSFLIGYLFYFLYFISYIN